MDSFPQEVWQQLAALSSSEMKLLLEAEAYPVAEKVRGHGLGLRIWQHGEKGPRILFLHGYLDTGRSWDAACALLAEKYQCTALDWRGHGQSESAGKGGSYHLQDHLKDLHSVVHEAALAEEPFAAIVAHSMGANIALMYAAAFSEHVPRLLLVDGCGPPAENPEEQPQRWRNLLLQGQKEQSFRPVKNADEAIARLQRMNAGLSAQGAARMIRHALVASENGEFMFPFVGRLRGPTPVRFTEKTWQEACSRVSGNVILLRAEYGYVPEGEPMTSRLEAMQGLLLQVEGAGHHLHVEHPEKIVSAVQMLFLSREG